MSDDWVFEPSVDEIMYAQKVKEQMAKDPEALERLMSYNPDKPIADEINTYFEQLGMDMRLQSIEPMAICYDMDCALCKEPMPMWSEGYYAQLSNGKMGYVCGDRASCSGRVLGQLFKKSVESDDGSPEDPFEDDDE